MTTTSDPVRNEPAEDFVELGPPPKTWVQKSGLDKYSALYLWAVFMIVFSLTQSQFLTWTSISLVLTEKAIVALLALAFLVPLVADTFDLSIGLMMGFSIVITTALAQNTGNPQALNAIIAVAACAAVGFVSGFIVVKLGVNSFIATLGMSQVLAAANILISGNRSINGSPQRRLPRLRPHEGLRSAAVLLLRHPDRSDPLVRPRTDAAREIPLRHRRQHRCRPSVGSAHRHDPLGHTRRLCGDRLVRRSDPHVEGRHLQQLGRTRLPLPGRGSGVLRCVAAQGAPERVGHADRRVRLAFGVKGLQLTFTTGTAWIEPLFEGVSLLIAVALASRQGIIKVPKRRKPTGDQPPDGAAEAVAAG